LVIFLADCVDSVCANQLKIGLNTEFEEYEEGGHFRLVTSWTSEAVQPWNDFDMEAQPPDTVAEPANWPDSIWPIGGAGNSPDAVWRIFEAHPGHAKG
jgi:hypothetical protein